MNKKDIIVVIQCAKGKNSPARHMLTENRKSIFFVAHPQKALSDNSIVYKHPDDLALSGLSWRDLLIEYNSKYKDNASDNPLGLLPAYKLYEPHSYRDIYRELVDKFGYENVFILSAGWGLIPADFLIPHYNITFSDEVRKEEPWAHRGKQDLYNDFAMLPKDTHKPIVFVGTEKYISLFCSLTEDIKSERIVFHNLKDKPKTPGCIPKRFKSRNKRAWHYECARELVQGNKVIVKSLNNRSNKIRMAKKRKISDALIEFAKSSKPFLKDLGMPKRISTKKEANHFFVSTILDRLVKASTAWKSGELIVTKYGSGKLDFLGKNKENQT